MEAISIYILKSAGLLSLFYLVYVLLLKNDTTFQLNRKFLIIGIIAAAILPAAVFTKTIQVGSQEMAVENFIITEDFTEDTTIPLQENLSGWQIAGSIYFLGLSFFLIRFGFQLISLLKVIRSQPKSKDSGMNVLYTEQDVPPFSFFKYIILNPALHSPEELKIIVQHEKIHAAQNHSADVLIANLTTAILWFNPLAWLYKKSILQNLEFIADKETIANNITKKEYQQTLLKVCMANFQPALSNSFYQSFIKKRILMLHKKSTSNNLWKITMAIPLVLAFLLVFNVKTVAQVNTSGSKTSTITTKNYSATISKNSSPEDLESLKKFMLKQNLVLEYEDISRATEGFLTSITVNYLNKNNNNSGNITKNNSAGISSFVIFVNNDGETGVADTRFSPDETKNSKDKVFDKIGLKPLYIINKKEYPAEQLYGKTIRLKSGFAFIAPDESTTIKKFGNKGVDGVILISEGDIIDDIKDEMKQIDFRNEKTTINFIQIEEGSKPTFITVENNPKNSKKNKNKSSASSNEKKSQSTQQSVSGSGALKTIKELEGDPVYVLNGKIVEKSEIDNLNVSNIEKVNVLKGKSAISLYGEAAKEGAVIITTKNEKDEKVNSKKSNNKKVMVFGTGATFEVDKPGIGTILARDSDDIYAYQNGTKSNPITSAKYQDSEKPFYVIDEIEMENEFYLNSIKPDEIASITVLKGKKAIKKYGKKAKNGAVEISTKKAYFENSPKIFVIKSSLSDAQLESIKDAAKQQSDFKLSFKNIKRNQAGLINAINVSINGNGQKASANYNVEDGIPDIYLGEKKDGGIIVTSSPVK